MFEWFKKKKSEPIQDTWFIGEASENGLPILIRMREQIPSNINKESYPHLISILWQYDGSQSNGMPRSEENSRMGKFESALDILEERLVAFMVVAITGNNRKEWIWYAADPQKYMSTVNEALSPSARYPIDFQVSSHPQWQTYFAFASNITKQ